MDSRRIVITVVAFGGLGIGCIPLLSGCSDDSKTTGTQVQMSPAVKAEIEDMKSTQKELMAERRAAAKNKKGRKK
jgi:hypothetical protein